MEDADVFALVGMLGKASAYFPVSYTEEYYEKDSEQNYENEYSENMTYVLNTDKTIKTEYINGSPYSYSYVAIDNDSDNQIPLSQPEPDMVQDSDNVEPLIQENLQQEMSGSETSEQEAIDIDSI